jgi:hypothetical protein
MYSLNKDLFVVGIGTMSQVRYTSHVLQTRRIPDAAWEHSDWCLSCADLEGTQSTIFQMAARKECWWLKPRNSIRGCVQQCDASSHPTTGGVP